MKRTFIIIIILAAANIAHADYHYASHEGSNVYPYTSWATAADSIQNAVNAADPGDTIYVGAGVWQEAINVYDNNLSLLGMGTDSTIFENYFSGTTIRLWNDTSVIEGFSFYADRQIIETDAISCAYWGFIEVKNNYFIGNSACIGGNLSGLIYNNYIEDNRRALRVVAIRDSLIFENNTIYDNYHFTPILIDDYMQDNSKCHIRKNIISYCDGGGSIFDFRYSGEDSIFIYNNIIYRRLASGMVPGYGYFGYAHPYAVFSNNYVDCKTIPGNMNPEYYTVGIEAYQADSTNVIFNNIFTNCRIGVKYEGPPPLFVRYSDFFNLEEELYHGDSVIFENCIFSDPMTLDSTDFHLQAYSPCIDTGDPNVYDPDSTISDMGVYGGPWGESYVYLDLPPEVPDSLEAEVAAGMDTIYFEWLFNTEADFNRYKLHRDTVDGFQPSVFNLIAEPETSIYVDTDFDLSHSYYYRVAAVDNQNNISEYSEQVGVIFTGIEDYFDTNLPKTAVLHQNYPNPFNRNTVIKYYLPDLGYQPAEVNLRIYDLLGRLVRDLVDENQFPGEYSANWDGKDNMGTDLPSGVYFYKLLVSKVEMARPRKLILLK